MAISNSTPEPEYTVFDGNDLDAVQPNFDDLTEDHQAEAEDADAPEDEIVADEETA